ncbi:MAG: type secretion system protein [Oscillospiraceae bacterium]|jgi:type IV pilus assembly protein PilB|nr:type secretion system protein [Oscillospiraceae bacterium]
MKNIPIGEVLIDYGYITQEQLERALEQQSKDKSKRLGAILIESGYLTETQMLEALGQRLQMQLVTLETYPIKIEAVERIPKQLAIKYNLIGISEKDGNLIVAVSDPLNFYAVEDIRQVTNMTLHIVLSEAKSITSAIEYFYAEIEAQKAVTQIRYTIDDSVIEAAAEAEVETENSAPVVKLLNSLLVKGYNTNASDIHIEIFESQTVIRMRVDGSIVDYVTLSSGLHSSLIARIKILANLDIAEKRMPQDGHFKTTIEGFEMNVRVSLIPTVYGEKAVIRFLYTNTQIDNMYYFGMNESNYKKMITMLKNPHGIIYLTGPTGSGKTTTLYMALEYLLSKQVNISTIEDPVERNIPRVNQMQVNNTAGLTFEAGLRALLRQDPDIIMVGETRDNETAEISIRAAITGHLVLSTMHTNDAVSAIVRLADMGLPPYLIASSLTCVVAQRLVRKVCPYCQVEYTPDEIEQSAIGADIQTVRKGKGCHLCNQTGYSGRIAIHEVVAIDKNIRRMITLSEPMDNIYDYAIHQQGVKTLKDSMLELVRGGITTVDEFIKIASFM